MTELQCYQPKINLSLFSDILAFALDTAEASYAQRAALTQRCPFPFSQGGGFQEKYGFLYLGELLERYEERFGMTVPDLRAIALALGYTHDVTTDEMFVGSQREDFLRRVTKAAPGDIYLTGALYLLHEGSSGMAEYEQQLTDTQYTATEDVLFAVSLFQDRERAFLRFKPQLLRLLGQERTIPVLGNATVYNWFIIWMAPALKACRSKDMALFRALCALPAAYVKPDGKSYQTLLEHGYTALEIAYGNMLTVLHQTAPGVLRTDSITSEKIAVALFREVFSCEESFAPEVYKQLSWVYRIYAAFKIRCNGNERLLQAFEDGTHIRNVETFIWFSKQENIYHQVFQGFDIMDGKWDPLAKALEPEQYRPLVDFCLREDMTPEEIQQRLERYQALTGNDYADIFWSESYAGRFGLLVNKGILDLWGLFRNSLDETGGVAEPGMLSNIRRYLRNISSKMACEFFEKFFTAYGAAGLEKYFSYEHRDFFEALAERSNYGSGPLRLKLRRDFLDEDGHRQLLHWLEEYVFLYHPEEYLTLIAAILKDEFAAGLFSPEEQRKLFDLTAKRPDISTYDLNELKRRYLTETELQAEQDARNAALRASEEQRQAALVQGIRDKYAGMVNGSFDAVIKFLDNYRYYREEQPIACRVVREHLDELLESRNYELDSQEAVRFLHVCDKLVSGDALGFAEAQAYITKVKEC